MGKRLIALLGAVMLLGGVALAQGTFASITIGVASVSGVADFPIGFHVGVENVGIQGLAIRSDASFLPVYGGIELGVDALYVYPVLDTISLYGGFGPRFAVFFGTYGFTAFGMAITAGTEYHLSPALGLLGEANVSPYFSGGLGAVMFGFSTGVSYHF